MLKKFYLPITILLLIAVLLSVLFLYKKQIGYPKEEPQVSPPIRYEPKTLRKEGYEIKRLLTKTDKKSGDLILADNSYFQILYLISNDQFIVRIKSTSYIESKEKAEKWFKDKGFTAEELCLLRISFVAPKDADTNIPEDGYLPEGCQRPQ